MFNCILFMSLKQNEKKEEYFYVFKKTIINIINYVF